MKTRTLVWLALLPNTALTACLVGDPNPYEEDAKGGAGAASLPSTGPNESPTTLEDSASPGTLRGDGSGGIAPSSSCSQSSTTPIQLEIINESRRDLELYWVDFQCEETFYRTIEQGSSYLQSTFAGHPWRIEFDGVLLYEYIPTDQGTQTLTLRF